MKIDAESRDQLCGVSDTEVSNQAGVSVDYEQSSFKPTTRRAVLTAMLGLGSAGCGSGVSVDTASSTSGSSPETEPPGTTPEPPTDNGPEIPENNSVFFADRSFDRASASRFLGQAGFGASDESIAAVLNRGYAGWIDDQMQMPDDASTYNYVIDNDWVNNSVGNSARFEGYSAAWMRMVTSPDELRQRMVAALCQIFVFNPFHVGQDHTRYSGSSWVDLISRHAFGSYRDLLEAVTTSHQMGMYLTLINSRREDGSGALPDENFAREVMQLFSIGLVELNLDGTARLDSNGNAIDTYDIDDILGLARAFTGWESTRVGDDNVNYWVEPMVQNAAFHESGEKRFLGSTIPAGKTGEESLQIALDAIASHANVAPFMSKLLIQRFIKSNPSPEYVERIATVFNDDGAGVRGNLGAVLKALLLDAEARGVPDKRDEEQGKLREPMISFAQLARFANRANVRLARDYVGWGLIFWWQEGFPQAPLASPSVFNFYPADYSPPGSELGERSLASPELFILDEPHVVIYSNIMLSIISNLSYRAQTFSDYDYLMVYADDASALVLKLNELLAGSNLTEQSIETITEAVNSLANSDNSEKLVRIKAAIYLVMISPDYLVQY